MTTSDTEVITSGRDYFNPLGNPQDRWMVTIPTAEKLEDNKGNPFVMYSVIIESDDCIWCVKRRYSEFKDLHDKFEDLYSKDASRLNLPPRKFGGNFKQEFINERRLKLQDYLNDIISIPKLFSSPEFNAFIETDNRHNLYIHRNSRKPHKDSERTINKSSNAMAVQNAGRQRKPSVHLQQIKYWVEGIKLKTLCDQPPVLSTSDAEVFVGFDKGDIVTYLGEFDESSDTLKVDLHGSTIWVHRNQVALFNLNDALSDDSEDELVGPKSASPIRSTKSGKSGQMRLGGFRSYSAHTLSELAHPTGTLFLSKETEAKVNRTKSFFDDYYRDLYRYHEQRKIRQNRLEEQLKELETDAKQELLRKHSARETALLRKKRIKMKPEDYQIIDMIGKGGFGKVYLARDKETSEVVALKKIKKSIIVQRNKVESIRTEREVLKGTMSPWLIKLICSFQDRDHLYFAMEYAPGGNLKCLLDSFVLPEESARFYVSEMILAVKSLHQLGFVHRDLKPDNFLFDIKGYIKLADFGLSKGGILKKLDNKSFVIRIYMPDDTFRTVALTSGNSVEEIVNIVRRKLTVAEDTNTNSEYGLFVVTAEGEERQLDSQDNVMTAYAEFGITHQFDGRGSLDLPSPRETKKYPFFLMRDMAKKASPPMEEPPVVTKNRSRSIGAYLSVAPGEYDRLSVRERRQQANQTFLKHAMYSFVGSPHYMAPEIIMKMGYDHLVDWWSIGCILYEMIVGVPPFLGDTPHEVFGNILDHEKLLTFPDDDEDTQISELTKDLIKKLLSPASTRLGKKGGYAEIQQHPYFSRVDWNGLRDQTPPFVPKLTSPTDTSYFHMAPEDKRSDSFSRSVGEGLDSGSTENLGESSSSPYNSISQNNNTEEDVLHEGLRSHARSKANHASIDSDREEEKGKKFYIPKKKGHKRNQSYDFVGFTYKPQSWMEISELSRDQQPTSFTNFESD